MDMYGYMSKKCIQQFCILKPTLYLVYIFYKLHIFVDLQFTLIHKVHKWPQNKEFNKSKLVFWKTALHLYVFSDTPCLYIFLSVCKHS